MSLAVVKGADTSKMESLGEEAGSGVRVVCKLYFLILTWGYVFHWFERERETSIWNKNINWLSPVCAWSGIKQATFWCMGCCSNQLSDLARSVNLVLTDCSRGAVMRSKCRGPASWEIWSGAPNARSTPGSWHRRKASGEHGSESLTTKQDDNDLVNLESDFQSYTEKERAVLWGERTSVVSRKHIYSSPGGRWCHEDTVK